MRERTQQVNNERRMLDASEACAYLGLGRCRGVEYAKAIGAEVKIGRRCLYDKVKIDKHLDELTGTESKEDIG